MIYLYLGFSLLSCILYIANTKQSKVGIVLLLAITGPMGLVVQGVISLAKK